MAYIYDLTDTWNAGGTAFNAIKMNVTDSASAAASKLVTLQTNGTEHFSVTKAGVGYFSGNVGIGTSSPGVKLDVDGVIRSNAWTFITPGTGTDNALYRASNTGGTIYMGLDNSAGGLSGAAYALSLYHSGAYPIVFSTNATERMRITSAGELLISRSSASGLGKLNVEGGADFTGGNVLMCRDTGNVGIGTSSPAVKLEVASADAITSLRVDTENAGVSANNYSEIALADNNAIRTWWRNVRDGSGKTAFGYNNHLAFLSDAGGTPTERMRIDSSGNVGIGTSSPSTILHVAGSSVTEVRVTSSGDLTTGAASLLRFGGSNSATSGYIGYGGTVSTIDLWNTLAGSLTFGTSNLERARIDSSGNLLVGKTSAGGAAPGLELANNGAYGGKIDFYRIDNANTQYHAEFRLTNGTTVGTISTTTTATSYNTSSDYRLKDIDGPITNSGAYIDALKPVQGSWKVDGSRFIGLLAHEVQEVSETPIATGEKDGEEMQAMDYSAPEIIANLIAEIQSLRARVAQLEGN